MTTETTNQISFKKLAPLGGAVALLGGIAWAAGFGSNSVLAIQGYLFAWVFWALIVLGCLGLTCLHHTLRASWGLSILRLAEAGSSPLTLGVTAVAFAPVLLNLDKLFWWAKPGIHSEHHPAYMGFRLLYLNPGFFIGRFVLYFAIWAIMSHIMRSSSRKQDETLDPELGVKRHTTGPVCLVIFFVTMTFAITDWVMSLERLWFSTILPLLSCVGGALSALSLFCWLILQKKHREQEPYATAITPQLTKDLGNMLFCLTMLWQYMTLSQYLITYSGHLPEEVPYYLSRNERGWEWQITANILLQFFVPFTALLAPRTKRYAKNMMWVVVIIFLMRISDVYWTIIPSMRGKEMTFGQSFLTWTDWAPFVGLGGLWFALFASQVHQAAILPKHDTRLLEVEHAH
ncbi:MAG: hypothetical protein ABL949_05280 [Fimbriimonadaceae bacterium]